VKHFAITQHHRHKGLQGQRGNREAVWGPLAMGNVCGVCDG